MYQERRVKCKKIEKLGKSYNAVVAVISIAWDAFKVTLPINCSFIPCPQAKPSF
jgi:hypothetical protein